MVPAAAKNAIREIVSAAGCARCLVFGSRARGDDLPGSDYDLLVIMDNDLSGREKIRLASQLRERFAEKDIDADIIIKSRKEAEYYKDKTGHIVKHAMLEGIPAW
jgi:predicted nucleotidyltransferase